jgi:hypothetical protein
MKSFGSRAGMGIALSAAALAIVWGLFIPYGYPWPSLAWVVLACAAAVWVASGAAGPSASMSDLIRRVEGEPALVPAVSKRAAASTRVVL